MTLPTTPPARSRAPRRTASLRADELRREVATEIGVPPGSLAGDARLVRPGLGSLEAMLLVPWWRRQGVPVGLGRVSKVPPRDGWHQHHTEARAAQETGAECWAPC